MKTRTPISDYYQFKQRMQGPEREENNSEKNVFLNEKKKKKEGNRKLQAQRV